MEIKFESFFSRIDADRTKVKFNMTAGRGGAKAWDNLQSETKNEDWYGMCAYKSLKGQASNNLEHYDYVLTFAQYYPYGPEYYIFGGLYKKIGLRNENTYELELMQDYEEYRKRLIIRLDSPIGRDVYSRRFENVCQRLNARVYEIIPEKNLTKFPGYNNIILSHSELQKLLKNEEKNDWRDALSRVKGVYCITDTKTGKLYIGSAYGKYAGIWQRWAAYASINNLTGGNKYFEDLKKKDAGYIIQNFTYSILEIMDPKTSDDDVIKREKHWKKVFKSKEFGMNENL